MCKIYHPNYLAHELPSFSFSSSSDWASFTCEVRGMAWWRFLAGASGHECCMQQQLLMLPYSNPPKRGLLAQSQVLGFLVWNWAFINILCSSLKVERESKVLVVKIGLRMTDYTSTGRIHWPRAPRRLWVPASQSQAWNDVMESMKKVLLRK